MSHPLLDSTAVSAIEIVIGTVGATALIWMGRNIPKSIKRLGQFLDDWNGVPARDGISQGTPGVMTRLQTLAARQAEMQADAKTVKETLAATTEDLTSRLDKIELHTSELATNGGSSIKDQMNILVPPEAKS